MDFQSLVDSCGMAAAVISVEEREDTLYGDIRIVRANNKYREIMGDGYRDNMIYSDLIPKEANFEDFCYRCAVKKQHLHAYIDTKAMGVWTDGTYIPLSSEVDEGNLHYFLFFFEFTKEPEAERMSDLSLDSAPFIIQTCINLRGSPNFCESMDKVISNIQAKTESFCSCIIMIDKERNRFAPLCSKFRDDVAKIDDFMPYLTPAVVFSWEETLKNHDNIIVKNEYDMSELEKRNPIWVESLRSAKVENMILVPLSQGTKLLGVLFITNFNIDRVIEIKEFITLTAFFLSAEIANNDLMERLEFMSNIDILTGVRNRNSMNARVDWHVTGDFPIKPPFGVIFADLNGLKQCNDLGGHEAGDRLLKKTALLLKKYFGQYEIFRAGGDEFVVIVTKCEKEIFDEKLKMLREESSFGNEVCLAIGADWSNGEKELRLCMHIADEAMYADKREYYKQHPELARR